MNCFCKPTGQPSFTLTLINVMCYLQPILLVNVTFLTCSNKQLPNDAYFMFNATNSIADV